MPPPLDRYDPHTLTIWGCILLTYHKERKVKIQIKVSWVITQSLKRLLYDDMLKSCKLKHISCRGIYRGFGQSHLHPIKHVTESAFDLRTRRDHQGMLQTYVGQMALIMGKLETLENLLERYLSIVKCGYLSIVKCLF